MPFKINYGQDPRMGFEGRRKRKYKAAGKFVEKMRKIQEEAKAALRKAQEEMKKGRRIQSRELSTIKYKGLEMVNEREKVGETDKALCGPL